MEASSAIAGTLIGALLICVLYVCIFIAVFLSALGIFRAGTGFAQKVKNDTRMTLYNKTLDAYRDYSNLIFNYINLVTEDDHFDLNNTEYKEAHQKLRYTSAEILLFADNNLCTQINSFIDYSLALSNNKEAIKNTDEAKQEFVKQLFALQRAIKNHLDATKPLIT